MPLNVIGHPFTKGLLSHFWHSSVEEVARHVGGPVPPGIKSNPTGNVDCCCHMAAATNQTLSYRAEVVASAGATDPPLQSSEAWVPK